MANEISLVVKAVDQASKVLDGIDKKIEGLGDGADNAGGGFKKLSGNITSIIGTIGAFSGAAVAAGIAAKKAFDLSKEGAAILQTEESFGLLLEKVGAAPDLLDDLRDAARGTIPDMKLMSSTATLLAGTQGDLARELAASTPKLLEIAKAANKLNPALGDTTFLYESLATGVKRASPMILDNLGLTIKIGDANEKLAKSLGKSVDQLTAEEQKMALLNETLRAGDVLIQQVGGNVDSLTDDYARMEATLANATDEMKKSLASLVISWQDATAAQNEFIFGTIFNS